MILSLINFHFYFILSLRETRRSNALLGVAIIITTPDESSQKIFLKQNLVVEDIFSQLFLSVKQVST